MPLTLKKSYGKRTFGADTMNSLLTAKLIADAPVHTLEMQQRGGVKGSKFGDRLVHLGADHSVPPAMAINVGRGFPDRKVWAASSAQTRAMHSLLLVPDGSYESMQHGVKELSTRPGGPPRLLRLTTCLTIMTSIWPTSGRMPVCRTLCTAFGGSSKPWTLRCAAPRRVAVLKTRADPR